MSVATDALLFGAGLIAGALNAIAGGGTLVTFPALLAAGLPPLVANATSSLAQWPGYLASGYAMRRELAASRAVLPGLAVASLAGGVAGGVLASVVSAVLFMRLVPWLILLATLLFWAAPRLTRPGGGQWPRTPLLACQFMVAVYGGFFGGGMGVMMLALFSLALPGGLLRAGALKNGLSVLIASGGVAAFIAAGLVDWRAGALTVAGTVAGGVAALELARRLPGLWLRRFVVVLGLVLTLVFFLR